VLPVKLEVELRDKVTVILGLEDSVADILVLMIWLCVATVLPVKLELELRDKVTVTDGLEDSVADTLVL